MAAWLLLMLALYAFGSYSYEVVGDTLRVHVRVLRMVPWGGLTVRLSQIKEAKKFRLREDWADWRYGWDLFGNVLTRKTVVIRAPEPRRALLRTEILVTPPDPDAFVAEINRLAEEARSRPGGAA